MLETVVSKMNASNRALIKGPQVIVGLPRPNICCNTSLLNDASLYRPHNSWDSFSTNMNAIPVPRRSTPIRG